MKTATHWLGVLAGVRFGRVYELSRSFVYYYGNLSRLLEKQSKPFWYCSLNSEVPP